MEVLLIIVGFISLAIGLYVMINYEPYQIGELKSVLTVMSSCSGAICILAGVGLSCGAMESSTDTKPTIQKPSPEICLEEVQRNFPEVDVYTIEKKMVGESWFLYSKHGVYHITTTNEGNCDINYMKLMYKQVGGFRKIDTVYIDTLKITDTIVDTLTFIVDSTYSDSLKLTDNEKYYDHSVSAKTITFTRGYTPMGKYAPVIRNGRCLLESVLIRE